MAKAIFESGPEIGKTIISSNLKRLRSTGTPAPQGIRSFQFQVNPKTGKEDVTVGLRYHRGFTPERMREVRNVENEGGLKIDASGGQGVEQHTKARVREQLARSAIPMSRLTTKNGQPNPLAIEVAGKSTTSLPSHARGVYYPTAKTLEILSDEVSSSVLEHEVAHHYDEGNDPKKFLDDLSNAKRDVVDVFGGMFGHLDLDPAEKIKATYTGSREGFADAERNKTFRPDPRKNRYNVVEPEYPILAGIGQHLPENTYGRVWADSYTGAGGEAEHPNSPRWKNVVKLTKTPERLQDAVPQFRGVASPQFRAAFAKASNYRFDNF